MTSVLRRFKNNKKKIYLLIIGLNMLIIAALISLNNISDKFATYNSQISYSIINLKYKVSQSHLWLEEYMNGDESEITSVNYYLEKGSKNINTLINGGLVNSMVFDASLNDKITNKYMFEIKSKFENFKESTKNRINSFSPIDIYADESFDKEFRSLIVEINSLDYYLKEKSKDMYMMYILDRNIVYTAVMLLVILAVYFVSKLNKEIEFGIKTIEIQSEELKNFNHKLEKRVEEEVKSNIVKEKEIFQQRKLIEMNDLLVNIGHHWRQPLSMISLIASSLKFKSDKNDENNHEELNNIIEYTRSLSKTIDYFHSTLSDNDKVETFTVKSMSNKIELLLEGVLRENNINLIIIHENEDIEVSTFMTKLITVILSIITNAKEVLIQRGVENRFIELRTIIDNDDIIIEVIDNAGGIPEEIINRVFEPYFTTNHQSVNKGLTMHLSYETVKTTLRGDIFVQNYNNGAKFIIKLPL